MGVWLNCFSGNGGNLWRDLHYNLQHTLGTLLTMMVIAVPYYNVTVFTVSIIVATNTITTITSIIYL